LVRREREPWSRKFLVEDCIRFDISKLGRAGVFRADPGTLCNSMWNDRTGCEIYRVYFWLETTDVDQRVVCVETDARAALSRQLSSRGQTIPIVQAQLYFGSRRYFLCPGVHDNTPCGRRVRILYLPPNASRLGCRECLHLIHRSAREHDKRIDELVRLPLEEFARVLTTGSAKQRLLAVRAYMVKLTRLRKEAERFASRSSSRNSVRCKPNAQ
jgi:hypothetical protein